MKEIYINGYEVQEWIENIVESPEQSIMITISRPHARCSNYKINSKTLEPIIQRIVELCNKNVFGKHKRFGALTGLITEECEDDDIPHYHIIFQRPAHIDYLTFKYRLEKTARLLNDEKFTFNLSDAYLSPAIKKSLSNPCYKDYIKVTATHDFLGRYLTKGLKSRYFVLNGRKSALEVNEVSIYRTYNTANTENYINRSTLINNVANI